MNKFLKFVTVATFVLATTLFSTSAFAQGGCIQFPTPPTFQGNPNNAPKYLVALGTNASGAPVTSDHIYTDNTLATEITQGTGVTVPQQIGTPINICALPGAYTLQFNSTAGGQGYFNYNIFVPPDTTKQSASATNIVDPTDNTKRLNFTASGMTTAKTLTLAAASANTRTYTLPDAGGNSTFMFIDAATSQNLKANAFTVVDQTDATKQLAFQASGATTGTKTILASATAANTTLTLPQALAGTNAGGIPVVISCGSTGVGNQTCTAAAANVKTTIVVGESTLSTNAAVITFPNSFSYTSTTSFFCVANDVTTRANPVQAVPTSGASFTLTNTTGGSDVIQWMCAGN